MLGLICPRLCISLLIVLLNGFLIWVKSSQAMLWYNIFLLTTKQILKNWTDFMNETLFYNIYNTDASFLIFPLGSIQPKMSGAGWPTLKKKKWFCDTLSGVVYAIGVYVWPPSGCDVVCSLLMILLACCDYVLNLHQVLNEICSKIRVDTSILWCHHVIKTIKWNEKNKNAFTKFYDEILVQKKYLMIWIST